MNQRIPGIPRNFLDQSESVFGTPGSREGSGGSCRGRPTNPHFARKFCFVLWKSVENSSNAMGTLSIRGRVGLAGLVLRSPFF